MDLADEAWVGARAHDEAVDQRRALELIGRWEDPMLQPLHVGDQRFEAVEIVGQRPMMPVAVNKDRHIKNALYWMVRS
jgi:hypothetical protein